MDQRRHRLEIDKSYLSFQQPLFGMGEGPVKEKDTLSLSHVYISVSFSHLNFKKLESSAMLQLKGRITTW